MFEWGHYCDVGLFLRPWTSQQAGGRAGSNHRRLPGSCSWTCKSQMPPPHLTVCVRWWPAGWNRALPQWRDWWHFRSPTQQQNHIRKLVLCQTCISQPDSSQGVSVFICLLCPLRWVPRNGMGKANSHRSSSQGSCVPWWWRSWAEQCLVPLSLRTAMSCWGTAPSPLLQMTLLQPLEISSPGQQPLVWIYRKPGVLSSAYFTAVEAITCVLNIISNERRLGGFIVIYKPFAASSLGILLFPAKACLWRRSSTCSYCCHPSYNYKKNWRGNLLSMSATHCQCQGAEI